MTCVNAGDQGGVASGHPAAVDVGLAILRQGGSSVDAVLAMAFAQWVVNGPLCGPGGDLVILHVDGDQATAYGGWSRTPLGFQVEGPIVMSGPAGAVVPGALVGADAAWRAAGRLPWAVLFGDALELAASHEVTPWMARSYTSVEERGHGGALRAILDVDTPPAVGERVSCHRLGRTLRRIAAGGAAAFYEGPLAEELLQACAAGGPPVTAADFASVESAVSRAAEADLGDVRVAVTPAPSQGGITTRLLAAADPAAAAESRAFAESVAPVTEQELTQRCVVGVPGTASSIATDGETSAVVVHSLAGVQYGSGWVAGDTGVAFGNRAGTALSTRPDLPAAHPAPGAVLPHTLSAAWFRSADRELLIATPGGDRQVQWLAQSGQRFRRGEPLEQIVAGPRWFVCPEGDRFGVPGGIGQEWFMFAEPDIEWAADPAVAGYAVRRTDSVGGGLQAVERNSTGWRVGSDPRAGGGAGTTADSGSHDGQTDGGQQDV
ncbi:MAG: gamma-glutamyltransferase [Acidimicrobiia bacterium]|jgi:gamma-glutamyltranspeptidase